MARSTQAREKRPVDSDDEDEVPDSQDRGQQSALLTPPISDQDTGANRQHRVQTPSQPTAASSAGTAGTGKILIEVKFQDQSMRLSMSRKMRFVKLFEAVEKKFKVQMNTLRYIYDGQRMSPHDTPDSLEMDEEKDRIDAVLEMTGGSD